MRLRDAESIPFLDAATSLGMTMHPISETLRATPFCWSSDGAAQGGRWRVLRVRRYTPSGDGIGFVPGPFVTRTEPCAETDAKPARSAASSMVSDIRVTQDVRLKLQVI